MIRGLLYWFFGGLLTLLWGIFAFIIYPFTHDKQSFYHSQIQCWSRFLLTVLCGVHLEIVGEEHIEKGKSYIIVSNHRSFSDILVGGAAVPLQFRWLAKESLFRIPFIGLGMRAAGYIAIVREKSMAASRSLESCADVLSRGYSVWIFPEGTRTPKEKLGNFKRGAFQLAQETRKPLLPVILVHTDDIFYRSYIIRNQRVRVIIAKPISFKDFKRAQLTDREVVRLLMQSVRQTLQAEYDANVAQSS